jgi:hypothetical protein
MKLRLSILLLAAALAASPAAGQTIKSLGYNTTNGNIVAATNVTFTNSVGFATNARAATRTNLGGTTVGNEVFTATNAAAAATAVGLGATNAVTFGTLTAELLQVRVGTNLYVGLADDVSEFWTDVAVNETLSVSGAATFSTNVTVNGNLSVGSLTTTTPSTWALDATQTAAATNGILALPSNANVIRLTNNNAISGVSGGVLGAFYYLVNQTTNAVTISNVGGITIQGGTPLTLGANQAATLVATGATNASVAARGDLNDVTLGGTLNKAPLQTADSADSLMTRDLSDARYGERTVLYLTNFVSVTNSTTPVDTPLSASLPVGNYLVRSALFAENAASAPGHAFQFGFTGVASPSRLLGQIGTLSGAGIRLDFPLTVTRSVSNSFITTVNVEGYVKVTVTGTLTVKYAQQTATTNVSQLKEGFLEVIKLP